MKRLTVTLKVPIWILDKFNLRMPSRPQESEARTSLHVARQQNHFERHLNKAFRHQKCIRRSGPPSASHACNAVIDLFISLKNAHSHTQHQINLELDKRYSNFMPNRIENGDLAFAELISLLSSADDDRLTSRRSVCLNNIRLSNSFHPVASTSCRRLYQFEIFERDNNQELLSGSQINDLE